MVKKMRILLTNISLIHPGGTELYTLDLAKYLSKIGHEITVFSPSLGPISEEIKKLKNVTATNNLEEIKNVKFDILHIHHNVNAYLVREYFPKVPALMVIHGVLPEFEQPPEMNLGISRYIAVSEEVKEYLIKNYNIPESKIEIIYNWVNTNKFKKKTDINKVPKKMLVVSNHYLGEHKEIYEAVCKKRGIELLHVGLPENSVTNVEDYMNDNDIVITLGRGAMEAMSLGRNVIISDIHGMDGMLTPEIYFESIKSNLSGRRFAKKLTVENFEKELDKYSISNGSEMQKIARKYHNREKNIKNILKQYEGILSSKVSIDKNFKKIMVELKVLSRASGLRESHIYNLELTKKNLEDSSLKNVKALKIANEKHSEELMEKTSELNLYKNSKIFKLANIWWNIRNKILRR